MRKSAENTEVKKTDKHTKKTAETKVKNQTAENQRLRAVAPLLTPRHHARKTCRDESFRLFCCCIAKLCVILQSCKQRSKHTHLNLSTYKKQNDEKEP